MIVVFASYACAGNAMIKRKETSGTRTAKRVSQHCFTARHSTTQPTSRCVRNVETGPMN